MIAHCQQGFTRNMLERASGFDWRFLGNGGWRSDNQDQG
jgi:hypothetical protein